MSRVKNPKFRQLEGWLIKGLTDIVNSGCLIFFLLLLTYLLLLRLTLFNQNVFNSFRCHV